MKRVLAVGVLVFSCGLLAADELYDELAASLQGAEALVAGIVLKGEAPVDAQQLEALQDLNRQVRGSMYSDLIDRSDLLLLLAQEQMILEQDTGTRVEGMLRDSREDRQDHRRNAARDKALRVCLNTTIVSFAAAFTFWGIGELQDRRYFQSATADEASLRRRLFELFSIGSLVGAAVGTVGAGVGVTLYAAGR